MSEPLFLVESPSKAASLVDLLSQKIDTLVIENPPFKVFLTTQRERKKRGRPFNFRAVPESQGIVNRIIRHEGDIYLAFDGDERGDHLSWMIKEFISENVGEFKEPKRLRIEGMTQDDIQHGMKDPFDNECEKGFTYEISSRFDDVLSRHFERLMGSRKSPDGLSLNFSVLTLLFFLMEREDDIGRFSPSNKAQIVTTLSSGEGT